MKEIIFPIIVVGIFLVLIVLGGVFWFKAYLADDKDFCLDTGRCVEGLEINTEHGKVIIDKQNCEKYGWSWDDERGFCEVR